MTDREPMKNDVPELWRQRAKAGLCPVCGKTSEEFDKGMRIYCSVKCRDKYASKYTFWSDERNRFMREHEEQCAICGITPEKIKKLKEETKKKIVKEWLSNPDNKKLLEEHRDTILVEWSKEWDDRFKSLMDDEWLLEHHYWDITGNHQMDLFHGKLPERLGFDLDHIIALCNGGDMWDKDNWQILCSVCHKEKTKKDLRERKRLKNNTMKLEICV